MLFQPLLPPAPPTSQCFVPKKIRPFFQATSNTLQVLLAAETMLASESFRAITAQKTLIIWGDGGPEYNGEQSSIRSGPRLQSVVPSAVTQTLKEDIQPSSPFSPFSVASTEPTGQKFTDRRSPPGRNSHLPPSTLPTFARRHLQPPFSELMSAFRGFWPLLKRRPPI